jgi:hypothetical protein
MCCESLERVSRSESSSWGEGRIREELGVSYAGRGFVEGNRGIHILGFRVFLKGFKHDLCLLFKKL